MTPTSPTIRATGETLDRWIQDHRNGDPHAGSKLVQDLSPRVRSFLYRMTANKQETDDLSQETFMKFFAALDGYHSQGRPVSYLLRIAANSLKNRVRNRREAPSSDVLGRLPSSTVGPADQAQIRDRSRRVANAVLAIPESDRGALVLREYHGLDYARIAEILNSTEGAVKQKIFRARRSLRKSLLTDTSQTLGEGARS